MSQEKSHFSEIIEIRISERFLLVKFFLVDWVEHQKLYQTTPQAFGRQSLINTYFTTILLHYYY